MRTRLLGQLLVAGIVACGSGDDSGAPKIGGADGGADATATVSDASATDAGPSLPVRPASSIAFFDHDPAKGSVDGTVSIGKATDESTVTAYDLYWGASPTGKLSPITTLAKTGSDLTFHLVGPIPAGAQYILVFSSNAAGEMPTGINEKTVDDEPTFVDMSFGFLADAGFVAGADGASAAIDTTNNKLLVATNDYQNNPAQKPMFLRCELDGTGCTYTDISVGHGAMCGQNLVMTLDTTNHKLLVVTDDGSNSNKPALFRCNLDGTGCAYTDISAGQPANSAGSFADSIERLSVNIDTTNQKLLVTTVDDANVGRPALFRCNLDGSSCTYSDLSAGQSAGLSNPTALIDAVNHKLLVAGEDGNLSNAAGLFRCALDGTGCTHADLSAGQGASSGLAPNATVDTVTNKLVVVATNQNNSSKLALYRCNLDGTSCTYADISAGQGSGSGGGPVIVDPVNQKLLTFGYSQLRDNNLGIYRCNLDGSACAYVDLSNSGWSGCNVATPLIDSVAKRVLLPVYCGTGARLGLIKFDL